MSSANLCSEEKKFYNRVMNARRYAICDIEATGLDEDKEIIEMALITFEDGKILEVFETLINPLRPLPEFVKELTSISDRELQSAPKFYEVADAIRLRLDGAVFVSHHVEFDYLLLKKKFHEMGQEFKMKTFCTLKVAQHEIPGLTSYNLDALCHFFGIKIKHRHRALGDAYAALELFKELLPLRLKTSEKILFLPHHEKMLAKVPGRAGLIKFKDQRGRIVHIESTQNMEKLARSFLLVKPDNKHLLVATQKIEFEITGSPLIAEFKKLLFKPDLPRWVILDFTSPSGEKALSIKPYKTGLVGLWYFKEYLDARKKLKQLEIILKPLHFAHREGGKSKEEILSHNKKVADLAKEARFPSENLIIMGEGRVINERSLVLVRGGHVLGHGFTEANVNEILMNPEAYLTQRFFKHLGADLAAKRYLRELKNMRQKTDSWRALMEAR